MTQYEITKQYILERLSSIGDGERITTVRDCIEQCKVSKGVVDRVITYLEGQGRLEIRPRSGLYKPKRAGHALHDIPVLHFSRNDIGNFHSELLYMINKEFSERSWGGRTYMLNKLPSPDKLIDELIRKQEPLVITASIQKKDFKYAKRLSDNGVKVIHLLPNTSENITPSLVLNDRKIVEMQVDYLLKCGYKRIACLHAITEDDYVRSQALRREAFLQLVFERHLEQESHWLCGIGWQPELIERKLSEMLAKAPCPDAFIINDAQAIGVYRCMEKLGLKPGRDIGIIGCDDLLCNQGLNVPLTTIGISRKAIAKTLGDVVDSGDFNEIRELNVELIERESTKH